MKHFLRLSLLAFCLASSRHGWGQNYLGCNEADIVKFLTARKTPKNKGHQFIIQERKTFKTTVNDVIPMPS